MFKKIISLMIFLAATHVIAAPEAILSEKEIKKTLTEFMQENHIPGLAVELYIDGKPQTYYLGYANEVKKIPVTKNTIFEVGSITKLMTGLLLAQQVDAAEAQFDNSISDYVSNLSDRFEDITLGNLATHTSGLAFALPDSIHSKAAMENYFSSAAPVYGIDEEWVYSNIGMGLLGTALEKMTHQSLDKLYRNNIFRLLQMKSSGLNEPAQLKKFIAMGHDEKGKPVKPNNIDLLPGGYGLKISAADMQRFLAAAIGLSGTPETLFYQIRMTQASYVELPDRKQGLGWEIHSLKPNKVGMLLEEPEKMNLGPVKIQQLYNKPKFNGDALIDKTGRTNGFAAYIAVIPNKQAGIVILANRVVPHDAIVTTAREILFNAAKIEIQE